MHDYSEFLDAIDDEIVVFEVETGRIVHSNQKCCERFGRTLDEMRSLGIGVLGSETPGYTPSDAAEWLRRAEQEGPQFFEWYASDGAGQHFWAEVRLQKAVLDGNPRIVAIARDISRRKAAEEALRASEERNRSLLELSPDAIVILQDAGYRFVNPAFTRIFGYTQEDVEAGLSFFQLVQEQDKDAVLQRYNDRLAGKPVPASFLIELVTKTGEKVPCETKAARIEHDGRPADLVAIRDISERKTIRHELQETKSLLSHLLTASPAVTYRSRAQGDYGAIYVSSNVERMVGYGPESFTSDSGFWLDHIHPDDRAQVLAEAEVLTADGSATLEYRFRQQSGEYVWMEDRLELVRGPDGEPLEIVGSWTDITKRKEIENAYVALVENSLQGLAVIQDERLVYVNDALAEVSGMTRDELLAMSPGEMFGGLHPEEASRRRAVHQDRLAGKPVPPRFEFRQVRRDGQVRVLEATASVIEFRGRPAVQAAVVDITARRELDRAILEASESERQRIALDLHDDIGQQLSGIGLMTKALEERLEAEMRTEAQAVRRVRELVGETMTKVRDLSRGLLPAEVETGKLAIAIESLAARARESSGIEFHLSIDQEAQVNDRSAATHLCRIAQEAVNNALKHAEASRIELALELCDGNCVLTIQDDGAGISGRSGEGDGLGIRLMEHRASLMGARLTIEPNEPRGTVVTCRAPVER